MNATALDPSERLIKLETAAAELVARIDLCQPGIDSAFLLAAVHGCPYDGPTYASQLEELRLVLQSSHAEWENT